MITEEFAEMLGVLLGDGCVGKYTSGGTEHFVVAFTGNSSEYWYHEQFIQPVYKAEFGMAGSLYRRRDGTTRYHIYGKKVATSILAKGVPLGEKHDACIPPDVIESGQIVAFIRGLYHAEGSIYRRCSRIYNRMKRVWFKSG